MRPFTRRAPAPAQGVGPPGAGTPASQAPRPAASAFYRLMQFCLLSKRIKGLSVFGLGFRIASRRDVDRASGQLLLHSLDLPALAFDVLTQFIPRHVID